MSLDALRVVSALSTLVVAGASVVGGFNPATLVFGPEREPDELYAWAVLARAASLGLTLATVLPWSATAALAAGVYAAAMIELRQPTAELAVAAAACLGVLGSVAVNRARASAAKTRGPGAGAALAARPPSTQRAGGRATPAKPHTPPKNAEDLSDGEVAAALETSPTVEDARRRATELRIERVRQRVAQLKGQ